MGKIKYKKLGVALSLVQSAAGKTLPIGCTRGSGTGVFHQTADHVLVSIILDFLVRAYKLIWAQCARVAVYVV